jgi:uncharacterized protein (TIGR02246 family)
MRAHIVALLIAGSFLLGCQVRAESDVAQTIIAMERAALDRWGKGDPQGFFEIMAADQTYFDPMTEKRIDGQADLKQYMAPFTGKIKIERVEMINPKVQQSGAIAVLTFNLIDHGAQVGDGPKTTARWNSTEVYQRINGSWKIIHSHWSNVKPGLNESNDARNADARAIRESETQWARAWAAKDVHRIVSHYADDASVELTGVPIMSGKDAIRARVSKTFADRNFTLSFAPVHVEVSRSGDLAYTQGAYTVTLTDPATDRPVTANGKYVIVYRKERDGRWMAIHDINNRDAPVPSAKP